MERGRQSPLWRRKLVRSHSSTLTWQNNCSTKFKVWFGSDSSFNKKAYAFKVKASNDDTGTVSKTLKSLEWLRIKMPVKNKTGSSIYCYIESWDELGRNAKTEIMSSTLTD